MEIQLHVNADKASTGRNTISRLQGHRVSAAPMWSKIFQVLQQVNNDHIKNKKWWAFKKHCTAHSPTHVAEQWSLTWIISLLSFTYKGSKSFKWNNEESRWCPSFCSQRSLDFNSQWQRGSLYLRDWLELLSCGCISAHFLPGKLKSWV